MFTTSQEEKIDSLSHFVGALLSISALTVLVVFAALRQSPARVVGFAIFGSGCILLYSASSLFHFFPENTRVKKIFQRLDHAMIFVLIASTYTPITLTIPQRGWGWALFGVIWGIAAIGIVLKNIPIKLPTIITPLLYVSMGWLIVIALGPLLRWLPAAALMWLGIGGILYTIGCCVYVLENRIKKISIFSLHNIFHFFVLAGTTSHFWFMLKYILPS